MAENMNILVLTTCYPLNKVNFAAVFLRTLYEKIAENPRINITVLAADHSCSSKESDLYLSKPNLRIVRYRYFIKKFQRLHYDDAALSRVRRNPLLYIQALLLLISQYVHAFKILRSEKFDLIHAHWALPCGLTGVLLNRKLTIPCVVTSHGGDIYGLRSKLCRNIMTGVFNQADMVAAVSEPVAEEIVRLAPNSRVEVISMGVNNHLFEPIDNAKERLQTGPSRKILLYVGRLDEKKGIHLLIRALPEIMHAFPDLILYIVGEGADKVKFMALIEQLELSDSVIFTGTMPNSELPLYYSAADLMILPSVEGVGGKEGLPVTIMESLLCGTRVVTTPVGGNRQLGHLNSVIFANENDCRDLAMKIIKQLKSESPTPVEQVVFEGMRFSIENIAAQYLNTYQTVLNKKN